MGQYVLNLNPQQNGDCEVHKVGCSFEPKNNILALGYFNSCQEAVSHARSCTDKVQINGCYFCSQACHTS